MLQHSLSSDSTEVSPKAQPLTKEKSFSTPLAEKLNVKSLKEIELIRRISDEVTEDMTQEHLDEIERANHMKFTDVYEDARVVGYGSFGIVIAGKIKETQEPVALKIAQLDPDSPSQAAKSLMRESSILEELDHPNVVKIEKQSQSYENYQIMQMELGNETLQ